MVRVRVSSVTLYILNMHTIKQTSTRKTEPFNKMI